MSAACDYHLPNWERAFRGATACDLPDRHEGPHRSVIIGGQRIEWVQPDPECGCDDCLYAEDPQDACVVWGALA